MYIGTKVDSNGEDGDDDGEDSEPAGILGRWRKWCE